MSFRPMAMAAFVMAFMPVSAIAQSAPQTADVPKLGTCVTSHGRNGVGMVGRTDGHRVDFAFEFVERPANPETGDLVMEFGLEPGCPAPPER